MADEWRKKTYYRPRVLIDTERILDPQFDDALLCITGAQLEMLRNLTAYLHRRSTFVSVYGEESYLAPTNAEWDELQAITADLEETLMGCDAITTLLEEIMECVCQLSSESETVPQVSPGLAPIVADYIEDGAMIPADTYGGDTVLEGDRCALAQLTFWQSWTWLVDWISPLQEASVFILFPLAMASIAVMVGTVVLSIPAGVFLAFITAVVFIWTEGTLQMVKNQIWMHKDDLICAVWAGLATDYHYAFRAAAEVIANIEGLSPIDIKVFNYMYSPWAIALAAKAHENETDWAIAHVDVGACDDCEWWYLDEYRFPPCPQGFTGSFPCSSQGRPGINATNYAYSPNFALPDVGSTVDMDIRATWRSRHGSGWTVGYITIQYQDVGLVWHDVTSRTCTNSVTAGLLNSGDWTPSINNIPRNVLRFYLHGQPGQGTSNPWPFEPESIDLIVYPHV